MRTYRPEPETVRSSVPPSPPDTVFRVRQSVPLSDAWISYALP